MTNCCLPGCKEEATHILIALKNSKFHMFCEKHYEISKFIVTELKLKFKVFKQSRGGRKNG